MAVTIRLALPADAPAMAEIHMRSWEAAYRDIVPAAYIREKNAGRLELWRRVITEDNDSRYIILADGNPAGMLCIGPSKDDDAADGDYELYAIYLHPDYYRQGIGTQAVDYAVDTARKLGKLSMTLWVFAENANAIAFYSAVGFAPDGMARTGEYGKTLDTIRMRRELQ